MLHPTSPDTEDESHQDADRQSRASQGKRIRDLLAHDIGHRAGAVKGSAEVATRQAGQESDVLAGYGEVETESVPKRLHLGGGNQALRQQSCQGISGGHAEGEESEADGRPCGCEPLPQAPEDGNQGAREKSIR
jgi:hypothetical protein